MTELEPSTPETTTFPPPPEMLSRITDFIGRHLQCTPEQRVVLALWILHTHCYSAFFTTPCLDIHSAHKQSGKSVCLQLLRLLCYEPWLTCGLSPSSLAQRVHHGPLTLLLDEREATLGSARRAKNPALLALLNSGFQNSVDHHHRHGSLDIFCPKAFAGTAPLPESLAERSIPIFLEPLQPEDPEDSEDSAQRFFPSQAQAEARTLLPWLQQWSKENLSRLSAETFRLPGGLSPVLSFRQQDLIEPLLHLAQAIGGPWLNQAVHALLAVFQQSLLPCQNYAVQLLADLEDVFQEPGDPRYLPTHHLLLWLHNLDDRPWCVWHEGRPLTDQDLAQMLRPLGVYPRNVRLTDTKVVRCYWRSEVEYASDQHQSRRQSLQSLKIEIPNKDAGCSKVVESSIPASSVADQAGVEQPSEETWCPEACPPGSAVEPPAPVPEVYVPPPQRPSYSEIVNKHRDSSKAKAPAIDTFPEYPQRFSYSG
jgi:hypothetical protein